jgi:hypothetical protein
MDFLKALVLFQLSELALDTILVIVIFIYVGSAVASPAPSSAGESVRKVFYTVAISTVCKFMNFSHVELRFHSRLGLGAWSSSYTCFPRDQFNV